MPALTLKNGCEMYYELHGRAKRTALMIHGLGGCGLFWTHHVEPLVAAGWRVLIADWPGAGRSGPCEADIDVYADSFIELAERLGVMEEPMVVCGHSAGGAFAQMIHCRAPERVAALVLMQTGSHFLDRRLRPFVNTVLPAYTSAMYHPAVANAAGAALGVLRKGAGFILGEDEPAVIFLQIGVLASRGKNAAAETCALANIDLSARLCEINVPALVIGSRFDPVVPLSRLREMQQSIPGSELRILERFGHNACMFHHKEASAFIVDFLSRHFPE